MPGSPVINTGAVYTCPVEIGNCAGLSGSGTDRRLYDNESECMHVIVNVQMLYG